MQFADVKNEIAFRKVFDSEQKTAPLISFLNASLELEGERRVVSVSIANPYQFSSLARGTTSHQRSVGFYPQTSRSHITNSPHST